MRYHVFTPVPGTTHKHLGSVVTPSLSRPAGAWQGRGVIVGQPGTQQISAPIPRGIPQSYAGGGRVGGRRSTDAPPHWYPSLYYTRELWKPPVAIRSDNQMPVPAIVPPNVIKAKPYIQRVGGRRAVNMPQVVQRWPSWGKNNG